MSNGREEEKQPGVNQHTAEQNAIIPTTIAKDNSISSCLILDSSRPCNHYIAQAFKDEVHMHVSYLYKSNWETLKDEMLVLDFLLGLFVSV